jgi:predicted metal-binding transcription factor (methanogenesis marker protein 9)
LHVLDCPIDLSNSITWTCPTASLRDLEQQFCRPPIDHCPIVQDLQICRPLRLVQQQQHMAHT